MPTTILLAHPNPWLRRTLRLAFDAEPDFMIAGAAANAEETAQMLSELHPDLLMLDLIMPGMSGLDVADRVRDLSARTQVLILAQDVVEPYRRLAQAHGIADCVDVIGACELVAAARGVVAGKAGS